MKHYLDIDDIVSVPALIQEALTLKNLPYAYEALGKHRTLGMHFL